MGGFVSEKCLAHLYLKTHLNTHLAKRLAVFIINTFRTFKQKMYFDGSSSVLFIVLFSFQRFEVIHRVTPVFSADQKFIVVQFREFFYFFVFRFLDPYRSY